MNAKKLSDIEYKYLFNIKELRLAYSMSRERNETIQKSIYFSEDLKKSIGEMSNDFASILDDIIDRHNIESFEDYRAALDALALANADIQIAVSEATREKQFHKYKKSHPLYNDLLKWQQIQNHIGSTEWLYLVAQNHRTALCNIGLWICILLILLVGMTSKNIIVLTCSIISFVIVALVLLAVTVAFSTQMERNYYIDQLHRIKNFTMFKSKEILKTKSANIFHLISLIHK